LDSSIFCTSSSFELFEIDIKIGFFASEDLQNEL